MTNRDTADATLGNAVDSEAAVPQVLQDLQFLVDLQREMREQAKDCQASPRFWTVGDYKWVECSEDNAERFSVYLPSAGMSYEINHYLQEVVERDDLSEDALSDLDDVSCEETGLEWIVEYEDEDASLHPERKEHCVHPNTMFLTKAEAKRHIKLNHYHYTSEAHTYAMTAWRAPMVERLLKILHEFDFDSLLPEGGEATLDPRGGDAK